MHSICSTFQKIPDYFRLSTFIVTFYFLKFILIVFLYVLIVTKMSKKRQPRWISKKWKWKWKWKVTQSAPKRLKNIKENNYKNNNNYSEQINLF